MRRSPLWRLVAALAVFALLVSGISTASVVAALPCDVTMASDAPCHEHQQGGDSDDQHSAPASRACFAKCPAPLLTGAAMGSAEPCLVRSSSYMAVCPSLSGIHVAPPLHPPRI